MVQNFNSRYIQGKGVFSPHTCTHMYNTLIYTTNYTMTSDYM